MDEERDIYREEILEHYRHPMNSGSLQKPTHTGVVSNPLCGDRLTLHIVEKKGVVEKIAFEGCGCAISVASASLMTEAVQGKSLSDVDNLFRDFHQLVTMGHDVELENKLGKLAVLAGVAEYQARVKCATLAWHTLKSALTNDANPVSTE